MDEVEYNGKNYLAFELVIDGAYNFFAEEGLLDAITENNECGCDLDNEVVFYPTKEQLEEMAKYKAEDNLEGLKEFLKENEIFFYRLLGNRLESGL